MTPRDGRTTRRARTAAVIALAVLLPPARAWADSDGEAVDKPQDDLFHPVPDDAMRGMDTDRPNATNTPHTIDAGHLQIETGLYDASHFHDRTHGGDVVTDALTLGHINTRLGLTDRLELNAIIDSYDHVKSTDRVGGKLDLWGDDAGDAPWESGFALQPQVKLPTAYVLVSQSSASLDHVIFGAVDVYVEYAVHATTESNAQPRQTVDLGFTYPVTDNLEIDSGVFIGTNKATLAIEWTSGVSFRY